MRFAEEVLELWFHGQSLSRRFAQRFRFRTPLVLVLDDIEQDDGIGTDR
jgi:hypothetical protein